jgi:hypothetical protein
MRAVLGNGACDAGGSSTALIDAAVDFSTWGIRESKAYAHNDTDDSYALITTVAANQLTTAALTGGADNTWSEDDSYYVEEIEATLDSIMVDPTPSTSDDTGTENLYIQYSRYARTMTADQDYSEIPDYALDTLLYASAIYALEKKEGVGTAVVANTTQMFKFEAAEVRRFMQRRGQTNYRRVRDVSLWGTGIGIHGRVQSATRQDPSPLTAG